MKSSPAWHTWCAFSGLNAVMSDIFLCYSRSDKVTADRLVERLRVHGWSVFIDVQLRVGDRWDKALEGELSAARSIVALWSARSRDSEYVLEEAEYGKQRGILFPVLIESVAPPYGFSRVQTGDLIGWQGDTTHTGLVGLLAALEHRLGPPAVEVPEASAASTLPPEQEALPQTPPPEVQMASKPTQPACPPQPPGGGSTLLVPKSLPKLIAAGIAGLAVLGILMFGGNRLHKPEPAEAGPSAKIADTPMRPQAFKPGQRFRDCQDAACPWLVVVPAGKFMMGSPAGEEGRDSDEDLLHPVEISRAFAVMETEVTRGQFARFAAETKYRGDERCKWDHPGFSQTDEHPVVCVSWNDATAFAAWLSKRTGEAYRLLSEAEWEYVARAGTTTRFAFGDDDASVCGNARLSCEAAGDAKGTVAAKSFKPNAFGLYDLHGNAWEWVQDCWHADYTGGPADGRAWETECSRGQRVPRGGGWINAAYTARSAGRSSGVPDNRFNVIGFRLSRTLPAQAPDFTEPGVESRRGQGWKYKPGEGGSS